MIGRPRTTPRIRAAKAPAVRAKRISVTTQLDREDFLCAHVVAKASGVSMAAFLRQAVALALRRHRGARRPVSWRILADELRVAVSSLPQIAQAHIVERPPRKGRLIGL